MKIPQDRITIERVLTNSRGEITALDIHDEQFGQAIFLEASGRHFHGFNETRKKLSAKLNNT